METVSWSSLTRLPAKAEYYRHEVYFREALDELSELYGRRLAEVLHRSALMIIRPEGLRSGRLPAVLDLLGRHGFVPLAAEPLRFDRFQTREMWRYQHTLASIDRLAATDQVLFAGPALVLLLRRDSAGGPPATVELCALKGPADPVGRSADTLRSLLDQPNRMLSLVHCADEPADLVREIGIAFDGGHRGRVLAALDRTALDEAGHRALADAQDLPEVTFDPDAAVERLRHALRLSVDDPAADRALALLDRLVAGEPGTWRPLMRTVPRSSARVDPMDLAVVGSCFIDYDEPGAVKLLIGPDRASWSTD